MATGKKNAVDSHFVPKLEAAIPTAKKTRGRPTAAVAASDEARREALLKELRTILPKLDAEGLDFLLEQAKTHLYNMEVERANEARNRRADGRSGKAAGSSSSTVLAVERSGSGSSYFVRAGGDSIMFTAEEMLSLVRIAHGHDDKLEAARAIGAWLLKERKDALEGLRLPASSRPALPELVALLQTNFKKPGGG